MSKEEIQTEKVDTQKELLAFEEKYGRPVITFVLIIDNLT
jgi:hypothetical protein